MSFEYDECRKRGKIKQFSRGKIICYKELETAKADLQRAVKTYEEKDYKWATIQIYYSMFHSARSLLYYENLREHSHYCLIASIRELFVNTGKIPLNIVEALQEAKNLREDADYYDRWSQAGCGELLKAAKDFIECAENLLKRGG